MNKCNVPKKKILVISNKFSQETTVLRKIVVQAKTLLQVIALFTVVILFILCARTSRLYFAVGKKRRHWFATARIIISGWKLAQHFQDIYWLMEHRNLKNWGGKATCKLQHRHSDNVSYRHWLKNKIIVIQESRFPLMWGL